MQEDLNSMHFLSSSHVVRLLRSNEDRHPKKTIERRKFCDFLSVDPSMIENRSADSEFAVRYFIALHSNNTSKSSCICAFALR